MPSIDIPRKLYKYFPAERVLSVMGKMLIRFSQANVMNDKSEFKPPIRGLATKPDLHLTLMERFKLKYPGKIELIEGLLPSHEAELLIQSCISKVADEAELTLQKSIDAMYEVATTNFGILSLSEIADSKLMWDRYAEGGTGFLVEFKPDHSWFCGKKEIGDDFRHLRRIDYRSDRPASYLLKMTGKDYFYTKGMEWEHEKEWRIIRNFNDATDNVGKGDGAADILLFTIPPDCIQSVVVGYNAMPELADRLQTMIAGNPALSHVNLNVAILKADLSLEIVPRDASRQ